MVLAIVLGLLVGTLNHAPVVTDLLWVQLQWPLGLVLLAALAAGLVLGLALSWLFATLPLRMQVRKLSRQGMSESKEVGQPYD
jgi:uncharacterized integral membrane protein